MGVNVLIMGSSFLRFMWPVSSINVSANIRLGNRALHAFHLFLRHQFFLHTCLLFLNIKSSTVDLNSLHQLSFLRRNCSGQGASEVQFGGLEGEVKVGF